MFSLLRDLDVFYFHYRPLDGSGSGVTGSLCYSTLWRKREPFATRLFVCPHFVVSCFSVVVCFSLGVEGGL